MPQPQLAEAIVTIPATTTIVSNLCLRTQALVKSVVIWCRIQFYSFYNFAEDCNVESDVIAISTESIIDCGVRLWDIMKIYSGCTSLLILKVI